MQIDPTYMKMHQIDPKIVLLQNLIPYNEIYQLKMYQIHNKKHSANNHG